MPSIPGASASGTGSCSSVRAPACRQASWAMPAPIVPAPTTPMVPATGASATLLGDQRVDPGRGAADDQLLDLGRPFMQRGHAYVAEIALHRVVVHVARAAVHLDRGVRTPLRRLGGVVLGD